MDEAFTVTRDIGETGPERMAPPRVAQYLEVCCNCSIKHRNNLKEFELIVLLQTAFSGSASVKVIVTKDQAVIEKEFPLMAAVNRCANSIERHQVRMNISQRFSILKVAHPPVLLN